MVHVQDEKQVHAMRLSRQDRSILNEWAATGEGPDDPATVDYLVSLIPKIVGELEAMDRLITELVAASEEAHTT